MEIIQHGNDNGIDIWSSYQSHCSFSALPTFHWLYHDYLVEMIKRETETLDEFVSGTLELIRNKIYEPIELDIRLSQVKGEPEFFNYLWRVNYSFLLDRKVEGNPCVKVW